MDETIPDVGFSIGTKSCTVRVRVSVRVTDLGLGLGLQVFLYVPYLPS
jgi:hypothetical protein